MDHAERLVSKAYGWIDQAAHELCWDEGYTKTRKGKTRGNAVDRWCAQQCGSRLPALLQCGSRLLVRLYSNRILVLQYNSILLLVH